MTTYFARHTRRLTVSDSVIEDLRNRNMIAVHYPGGDATDSRSLDPATYPKAGDQRAIRILNELALNGGYVWAEYRTSQTASIGFVEPGSEVDLFESVWNEVHPGRIAVLKRLRLLRVRHVLPSELLNLRATRPRQGTICRWNKPKDTVERLVDGRPIPFDRRSLAPGQLETACTEYLRRVKHPSVPRLRALLMPVGRTMKDLDLYGLSEDGGEILGQVTLHRREEAEEKFSKLLPYLEPGTHVLLFCESDHIEVEQGIVIIPVQFVEDWLREHRDLVEALTPVLSEPFDPGGMRPVSPS